MEITTASPLGGNYATLPDGPEQLRHHLTGVKRMPELTEQILDWAARSRGVAPGVDHAMQCLAWADGLQWACRVLPEEAREALIEALLRIANDAQGLSLEQDPLVHQLLAGELGLNLAFWLAKDGRGRSLKAPARQALSTGLVDLLDQGMPKARNMAVLRPLLACWTRCRKLGESLPGGGWSKTAEKQYQALVGHAIRLARYDGTHAFSNGEAGPWGAELFESILQTGSTDEQRRLAAMVLPAAANGRAASKRASREAIKAKPAVHSEWAAAAVLRPDWSRDADRLVVLYPDSSVRMEMTCGRHMLWSGDWTWEVSLNGSVASPASSWESTCWFSDDDVDYLELEIALTSGLRMQRHILLARKDRFLFLADAVLGDQSGELHYRSSLPLSSGVCLQGAKETREGYLLAAGCGKKGSKSLTPGKRLALVLPLALPEWKGDTGPGTLSAPSDCLELQQQQAEGRRLFAPLFFDLDRRRMAQRMTWRQLTVAESMKTQSPDVAVGYRVALGKEQWLIYRSLAQKANRTVLGHNLSTETLVARFDKGEVESLVEIE